MVNRSIKYTLEVDCDNTCTFHVTQNATEWLSAPVQGAGTVLDEFMHNRKISAKKLVDDQPWCYASVYNFIGGFMEDRLSVTDQPIRASPL